MSWATLDARARSFVDEAGTPIDGEVQPLVAALWGHGLTTSGSCWGHLFDDEPCDDPAFPRVATPWVLIEAPTGEPDPRDVTAEELAARPALRAHVAAWRRGNYELLGRLSSLLEAFYARRSVPTTCSCTLACRTATRGSCSSSRSAPTPPGSCPGRSRPSGSRATRRSCERSRCSSGPGHRPVRRLNPKARGSLPWGGLSTS